MMRILFRQSKRCFTTILGLILAALIVPPAARAEWQIVVTTPSKGKYTHPVIKSDGLTLSDESVTYDMDYQAGSGGSYNFHDWPSVNPFQGKIDIKMALTAKLTWVGGGSGSGSSSSSSSSTPPRVIYIKETLSASAGAEGPTRKRGPYDGEILETPLIPSLTAELGGGGFVVNRVDDTEGDSQSKAVSGTKITRYEVPEEPNADGNWEITLKQNPSAIVSATGWMWGEMSCGVNWDVSVHTFSIGSNIETSFRKGADVTASGVVYYPVPIENPADNKTLESVVSWNDNLQIWQGQANYYAHTDALSLPQYHWQTSGASVFSEPGDLPDTSFEQPPYFMKSFKFDLGNDYKTLPKNTTINVIAAHNVPDNSILKGKFNVAWHFPIEDYSPDSARPKTSQDVNYDSGWGPLGRNISWEEDAISAQAVIGGGAFAVGLIDVGKAVADGVLMLSRVQKVLLEVAKAVISIVTGPVQPTTDSKETTYGDWASAWNSYQSGNNTSTIDDSVTIIENPDDFPEGYSPGTSASADAYSGWIESRCRIRRKLWHHPYWGQGYNHNGYAGPVYDSIPALSGKDKIVTYRWNGPVGPPVGPTPTPTPEPTPTATPGP